jgi:hypothetical protein
MLIVFIINFLKELKYKSWKYSQFIVRSSQLFFNLTKNYSDDWEPFQSELQDLLDTLTLMMLRELEYDTSTAVFNAISTCVNIAKIGEFYSAKFFFENNFFSGLSIAVRVFSQEATCQSYEILSEAIKFLRTITMRSCSQSEFNELHLLLLTSKLLQSLGNIVTNVRELSLVDESSEFLLDHFMSCDCNQKCNLWIMNDWFELVLNIFNTTCTKNLMIKSADCIVNAVKCYICKQIHFESMKELFTTVKFRSTVTLMFDNSLTNSYAVDILSILVLKWNLFWWVTTSKPDSC